MPPEAITKAMPPGPPAEAAKTSDVLSNVFQAADKAAQKSDRWWLAVLIGFGLVSMYMMMRWHREDQQMMTKLYADTIKANTEALIRNSTALERMERKLEDKQR